MRANQKLQLSLSEPDRQRFGIITARAWVESPDDIAACEAYCHDNNVRLLIVRCPTTSIDVVHAVEAGGGCLMECQVCYRRDLRRHPDEGEANALDYIREARPSDTQAIASLATRAFEGHPGHYSADPRLQRSAVVETYSDWAMRLCQGADPAHHILVVSHDDAIAGFAVMRLNTPLECEILLGAVAPEHQGSGLPAAFGRKIVQWAAASRARYVILWTHVRNITLQRALIRNKADPISSRYVMHKWYDR